MSFYDNLILKNFTWATKDDLCGQIGIYCDYGKEDRRVNMMYFLFPHFIAFLNKHMDFKIKNRDLHGMGLVGTIPTDFGSLSALTHL